MSYVSYSENILKRHQSDVFDLLRELDSGGIAEARQQNAVPEFESLVRQLGEMLSDPNQPAAMRLLSLRQAQVNLSFDLDRANEKVSRLGATNQSLNEEKRHLDKDIRGLRDEAKILREASKNALAQADKELLRMAKERDQLKSQVTDLKARIARLEMVALQAQVDRRY